jgi:hypothetical protein
MHVHFLKFLVSAFTFANWSAAETNFLFTQFIRPWILGRGLGGPQKQRGYLTNGTEQSPRSVRYDSPHIFFFLPHVPQALLNMLPLISLS